MTQTDNQNEDAAANQRSFLRVDDYLPFSWRKLAPKEMVELLAFYEKNRTFPRSGDFNEMLAHLDISDKLQQLEQKDPILARILSRMDMKLNILIRLFHPDQNDHPLTPTPLNLGGGGLAFWMTSPPLVPGDALYMRMALSPDSLATLECYGMVVKLFKNHRENMSKVAVRFNPIRDPDRERLIQHIFQRQAENLRAQRGESAT
jgi:hypothetical protein